jgi:hypothetical protein
MDYSLRGLSVGTLRLKILIRTHPFLLDLSNKKSEGNDEMMERQERQHLTAIQAEITFSAR